MADLARDELEELDELDELELEESEEEELDELDELELELEMTLDLGNFFFSGSGFCVGSSSGLGLKTMSSP